MNEPLSAIAAEINQRIERGRSKCAVIMRNYAERMASVMQKWKHNWPRLADEHGLAARFYLSTTHRRGAAAPPVGRQNEARRSYNIGLGPGWVAVDLGRRRRPDVPGRPER